MSKCMRNTTRSSSDSTKFSQCLKFAVMAYILCFIFILIFSAYLLATRKFNYWRNRGIPFDKPAPFAGNWSLVLFKHSLGSYMMELYKKFDSPLMGFFLFDQPQLVVKDPKIIKAVLIEDFQNFNDRTPTVNLRDDPVGTQILFLLKNPHWKVIRQKMSFAFTSSKMKLMFPLITDVGQHMVEYLRKNCHVSMNSKDLTTRYMTDVIASCAFGVKAFSFVHDKSEFRYISQNAFKFTWLRGIEMSCYFISPLLVKLFKMKFVEPRSCKMMEDIFWQIVKERRQANYKRNDLVDILIEIQEDDDGEGKSKFDGDIVVAQAVQFLSAGFETSSSLCYFALYEISLNRNIQKKLRSEITETLAKYDGITYEAVQGMKYLDMVVHEALRKYPILPFLDRLSNDDYYIPEQGVTIEKGIAVYIPVMAIHHDPNYYPNPEKFDPERFTPENKAIRPSCVFLGFGDGPRNCIGLRFGLLAVKVLLINILKEYDVLRTENTPLHIEFNPRAFILATVKPIQLKFKKLE